LYLWVNAYKANIADSDHEMGHGHMITFIVSFVFIASRSALPGTQHVLIRNHPDII
jgi:hypothetical protein